MKTTDVKNEFKTKANGAQKNAKNTIDDAIDSAPEVLEKVTELGKSFLDSVSGSKEKAVEVATTSLQTLNRVLKERPWAFVGGAVVVGFTAGYLIGHGRRPLSAVASDMKSGIDKLKDQIERNINKVSEHLQ